MTITSVTIAILGVDERSKSAYQYFFASLKNIQCQLIDDYSKAQLCLFDKDSYNSQQQYESLIENYPDKYILLLSLDEQTCTHKKTLFLKKPVKRNALQKSLKQICHLLSTKHMEAPEQSFALQNAQDNTVVTIKKNQSVSTANVGKLLRNEQEQHFVGEQPNIDINHPEQLKKAFYEHNKLLPTFVQQACIKSRKSEQIIQLSISELIFYFDYQEQKVYSNMGPGIIRPLCLIRHDNKNINYRVKDKLFRNQLHDISQSNKKKTIKKTMEKQSWNMESFIWLITLWSSRGRVPRGTDLTQPVYLMQWPNLTRLAPIPHAVRIAALIYAQPRTLTDTAKQLGIEQRYVFAFYSACKAIGLSNISRRQVDKLFAAEKPEQHKNQSILSKLLGKLVNFTDKSSMNDIA